jgi:hypothetical protein
MHSDHPEVQPHHRPKHTAERIQGLLGKVVIVAIVLLAIGMIYGMMTTGNATPSWMH